MQALDFPLLVRDGGITLQTDLQVIIHVPKYVMSHPERSFCNS